jgi:16S rRNA (guanine966-N2)-methyltransferase
MTGKSPHPPRILYRTKNKLETTTLRIIAGNLRTRKIQFAVDPRTRPMKDRTREAVMSLLGGTFPDAAVFDLFGGTGVLAFETLSRGASAGVIFEILRQAVREIQANSKSLGVEDRTRVLQADVIDWSDGLPTCCEQFELKPSQKWVVFCCPPYALWDSDGERLKQMLMNWWKAAPIGSLFAVELELKTPMNYLPDGIEWDARIYKPARMAVAEKI